MKELPKIARKLLWVTAALVVGSGLLLALALVLLSIQQSIQIHAI